MFCIYVKLLNRMLSGDTDNTVWFLIIQGAYHLHGPENPEIPVGKSNGTHHSIWSTSEIMGFWSK